MFNWFKRPLLDYPSVEEYRTCRTRRIEMDKVEFDADVQYVLSRHRPRLQKAMWAGDTFYLVDNSLSDDYKTLRSRTEAATILRKELEDKGFTGAQLYQYNDGRGIGIRFEV